MYSSWPLIHHHPLTKCVTSSVISIIKLLKILLDQDAGASLCIAGRVVRGWTEGEQCEKEGAPTAIPADRGKCMRNETEKGGAAPPARRIADRADRRPPQPTGEHTAASVRRHPRAERHVTAVGTCPVSPLSIKYVTSGSCPTRAIPLIEIILYFIREKICIRTLIKNHDGVEKRIRAPAAAAGWSRAVIQFT